MVCLGHCPTSLACWTSRKATFDLLVAERPPGARSEMAKKLGESVSEEEHYSVLAEWNRCFARGKVAKEASNETVVDLCVAVPPNDLSFNPFPFAT